MYNYSQWQKIINEFIKICKTRNLYYNNPRWLEDEGTINVIGVRNNNEICFNDQIRNNDDLYFIINKPDDRYIRLHYKCTIDPATNKHRIAHMSEGAWECYDVRNHRHIPGRTALCQDKGKVLVSRTDISRKVIAKEWGYFGINIHDDGGFWNSSLGCTIYSKVHQPEIKSILLAAKKVHDAKNLKFTYFLINHETLKQITTKLNIKAGE